MNMTVSNIGKDGTGYFTGFLSPEKLNKNGLLHDVLAWSIDVDYKRERSKLMTFLWLNGMPQKFYVMLNDAPFLPYHSTDYFAQMFTAMSEFATFSEYGIQGGN